MSEHGSDKPDIGEGEYRFVWVFDFPMFEYNEEEKRWQTCHHPFTSPHQDDIPFLKEISQKPLEHIHSRDLSKVRARSYDLVLNGQEIASGSIRIHSPSLQQCVFRILGIGTADAEKKFGFLLRSFTYGAPPHGGIAFGLDRLYAIMSGSESIRDVIAFPKTQKGVCPLTEAPSGVDTKQIKELSLSLMEEDDA